MGVVTDSDIAGNSGAIDGDGGGSNGLGNLLVDGTSYSNAQSIAIAGNDGDYADVTYNGTYFGQTADVSSFAWVKSTDNNATPSVIISHWGADADRRKWYYGLRSGVFEVVVDSDGDQITQKQYQSVATINDDAWHFVGFTFAADTLKIYVDGVLLSGGALSAVQDDTMNTLYANTTDPIRIAGFVRAAGTLPITGNVDDITWWDKVLSDAEVTELYNNGSPNDAREHSGAGDLAAYWTFNEDSGSTVTDIVNSQNGTIAAGITFSTDTP